MVATHKHDDIKVSEATKAFSAPKGTLHDHIKEVYSNCGAATLTSSQCPLVSVFGRLVARSGRKRGNRETDRQTDRQTQTKYCNPRCACAPRVNNVVHVQVLIGACVHSK